MHPDLRFGPLRLRVGNLDSMLSFYVDDLGFTVTRRHGDTVELSTHTGAKQPLLILNDDHEAKMPAANSAGLYHFAILVPDRKSLAEAYLSIGNAGVVFDGFADHLVSEALYLTDPEGNGIEIYADRPRTEWKFDDGTLRMATEPLDIDLLIRETGNENRPSTQRFLQGARLGHVHLKVTEIPKSLAFYRDLLGLDLMSFWGSAAFLSAGGYHHHIGINAWYSYMGTHAERGVTGLESFALSIPDETYVSELASRLSDANVLEMHGSSGFLAVDPDGIRFLVEMAR